MPILDADFKREVKDKVNDYYDQGKQYATQAFELSKRGMSKVDWTTALASTVLSIGLGALGLWMYDNKKVDPIATDAESNKKSLEDILKAVQDMQSEQTSLHKQLVEKEIIAKKDELSMALSSDYITRRNNALRHSRANYSNTLLDGSGYVTRPLIFDPKNKDTVSQPTNTTSTVNEKPVVPTSSDLSVVYKNE